MVHFNIIVVAVRLGTREEIYYSFSKRRTSLRQNKKTLSAFELYDFKLRSEQGSLSET